MQAYPKRKRTGFTLGLGMAAMLLLPLAGVFGCQNKDEDAKRERVLNVRVRAAEVQTVRPYIEAVGALKPYEEVIVSSEVDGILRRVLVDGLSEVQSGEEVDQVLRSDERDDERDATGEEDADHAVGSAQPCAANQSPAT